MAAATATAGPKVIPTTAQIIPAAPEVFTTASEVIFSTAPRSGGCHVPSSVSGSNGSHTSWVLEEFNYK